MIDAKAKRILFRSYWKNGWLADDERYTSPEDLAYAKAQGVMFEPVTWTHDESVVAVQEFRSTDIGRRIAAGLVASLTSRRLDWRSAAASWAMIERLPPHDYTPYETGRSYDGSGNVIGRGYACDVCVGDRAGGGLVGTEIDADVDLSVLNFERLKWGGVRHNYLTYARFDLGLFLAAEAPRPVDEDWALMQSVLTAVDSVPETATAGGLVKELKGWLPGTAAEHRGLVEILGTAGILRPQSYDRSVHGKSDWAAAAEQWRGADRYDRERVAALMPHMATS